MADNEPSNKPKRKLRAPAPTMREQAEKAIVSADKPKRNRRLKAAGTKVSKPLSFVGKVFNRQPFRFIGRILLPRFLRNAYGELKLVDWPDRKQTRQLTTAVLFFAIVFGATIAIVDYGLDKLFRAILLK